MELTRFELVFTGLQPVALALTKLQLLFGSNFFKSFMVLLRIELRLERSKRPSIPLAHSTIYPVIPNRTGTTKSEALRAIHYLITGVRSEGIKPSFLGLKARYSVIELRPQRIRRELNSHLLV